MLKYSLYIVIECFGDFYFILFYLFFCVWEGVCVESECVCVSGLDSVCVCVCVCV